MNTVIRFLTFSAFRPTHWYERGVYMLVRGLLALAALVPSFLVSTPKTAPWILLSTLVSLVGAWSAQVARSGAARREETRRARNETDVGLSCDAKLRRAAALGSFFASLAPLIALGMTLASASSSMTIVAGIAGAAGSAFDVAWSVWIYPAWRRTYVTKRDELRMWNTVEAMIEYKPCPPMTLKQEALADRMFEETEKWPADRETDVDADAPTEVMTRAVFSADGKRSGGLNELLTYVPIYVRCESLDEILAKVDADIANVGTRLYLNDDSPVVERGEGGWHVDWLDGTTGPVFLLSGGEERDRFLAMAEGREA